jgi:flagellar hook-length control protein FliK
LLLHAKTAFRAMLGEKAAATKKGRAGGASAFKAALSKALEKNPPVGNAHLHGLTVAPAKKEIAGAHERLALAAEREQAQHQQTSSTKAVLEIAGQAVQSDKKLRKKPLPAPRHADGSGLEVALIAGNLNTKNLSEPDFKRIDAPKALEAEVHAGAVFHAVARKVPEMRVHVLDARKKHGDGPTEDFSNALKAPKLAASHKEGSAPIVLRNTGVSESSTRETRVQSPPPPTPFAGALEHLREMAGSVLTRAAAIILRDGGGEIKLTLKPESLGSVRIRMNLVDNAIEGRIIVDNSAVKHVFEGSLDSLMRALTAEGFQTASLQVSVGGQNADNGRPDKEPAPRIRQVSVQGSTADWNVPGAESMRLGDFLVNLFV